MLIRRLHVDLYCCEIRIANRFVVACAPHVRKSMELLRLPGCNTAKLLTMNHLSPRSVRTVCIQHVARDDRYQVPHNASRAIAVVHERKEHL